MPHIPHFSNGAEFDRFCLNLSKEAIHKMNTDDWIRFLYEADKLAYKEKMTKSDVFIKAHQKAFAYMYSNFRMNKETTREIKNLAYQMADALSDSKEFSDLYFNIDVAVCHDDATDEYAAKKMRKAFYDKYFGSSLGKSLLKPKIKMVTGKLDYGGFFYEKNLSRKICLSGQYSHFCNTVAHELYHSLQFIGHSKRTKFMEKLGIKVPYDAKMSELYMLNRVFYINMEDNKQGYLKQPLEYGARFFATCFERRLRHNIKAAENNWGMLYMSSQIMRGLKLYDNRNGYSSNNVILSYDEPSEKTKSVINEISSRYLKPVNVTEKDGTLTLVIDRNVNNIININKLFTQIRKAERSESVESDFIKKYLPLTYKRFYATEEERLAYKPVLSRVKINRI